MLDCWPIVAAKAGQQNDIDMEDHVEKDAELLEALIDNEI